MTISATPVTAPRGGEEKTARAVTFALTTPVTTAPAGIRMTTRSRATAPTTHMVNIVNILIYALKIHVEIEANAKC